MIIIVYFGFSIFEEYSAGKKVWIGKKWGGIHVSSQKSFLPLQYTDLVIFNLASLYKNEAFLCKYLARLVCDHRKRPLYASNSTDDFFLP
jgi:hypothetical protein